MRARGSVLLLALMVIAPAAKAQAPAACRPEETIERCFSRMRDSRPGTSDAAATLERRAAIPADTVETRQQAVKATVGAQTAGDDLGSAIRDFLPPIAAALLTPGLEGDRAALSFRANHRLWFGTFQFGAEFPEPAVFTPLLEAVPEAEREAVRERLEERLEDQDDVSGSVALNLENRWFGRSFRPHASYITDALLILLPGLTRAEEDTLDAALLEAIGGARRNLDPSRTSDPACAQTLSPSDWRVSCLRPEFRAVLSDRFLTAASALAARAERRRAALDSLRVDVLSMLLNNQPQLNATVTYRYRGDLVGPDEVTGSLRLEVSRHNLNELRRRCPRNRGDLRNDWRFLGCIRAELTGMRDRLADALARGQRFWLKVDFSRRAEYNVALVEEGITVVDDRSLELDGSLGYGQYFGKLAQGTRRPRIDGALSYKHQLEGELRNDRLVAKVALTHPLSDQLAAVFGAVWANRPEYVGDVQRRVSARLGLAYKLVDRE